MQRFYFLGKTKSIRVYKRTTNCAISGILNALTFAFEVALHNIKMNGKIHANNFEF